MFASESIFPHLNASLNALATVLLVAGYVLIKRGYERAHRRTMVSCFGVSVLFSVLLPLLSRDCERRPKHEISGLPSSWNPIFLLCDPAVAHCVSHDGAVSCPGDDLPGLP